MSANRLTVVVLLLTGVLVLSAVVGTTSYIQTHSLRAHRASSGLTPAATTVSLSDNGLGPTTISLTWSESGDLFFVSYTIQYSTTSSNGPWTTLAVIGTISDTSEYVYGNAPTATYWWQIIDTDSLGSATSNTLQVTQPPTATLSMTQPTSTSAQFTWNNNAQYGGFVAFGSYQLLESVNGGSYSSVTSITTESTMAYTLNGLSSGTSYSFELETTDQCNGCSGGTYSSSSYSNVVTTNTPYPLSAAASAKPTSVDIGQPVTFNCAPSGGVSPYTYSWAFGDGSSGTGQSPSHTYLVAGSENAVCTVTDKSSTTATSAVAISVTSDPSVTTPAASLSRADVGQTVQFTTSASGGSGSYQFKWTGLPSGCGSSNAPTITCVPTGSGQSSVTATVTDSNGFVNTSSPLLFQTAADPAITSFTASPTSLTVGGTVAFVAVVSGGSSPLTYSYSSLPPGCLSTDSSALSCKTSGAGSFTVVLTVTDGVGLSTSAKVNVTVNSVAPTFLGLPETEGYALVAGVIAAIVIAVAVGVAVTRRSKRRRPPAEPYVPSQTKANPPPPGT